MRSLSRSRLLVLALLAGGGLLSASVVRAAAPPGEKKPSPAPLETVIPSQAVSSVLDDVAAARQQIARGLDGQATETLGAPRDLLGTYLKDERAARVRHGIRATLRRAQHGNGDDDALLVQIEPFLEQLDPAVEGEPDWMADQQLRAAKLLLQKGDRAGAIAKLRAADGQLRFPEAELPLDTAYEHVLSAIDALEAGNPQEADAELAALEREARFQGGAVGTAAP